jgi:hypothetical protein
MPTYVHETEGDFSEDREHPPTGQQPAIAARLYQLGWQPGYQGKKPVEKVVILWELMAKMTKGDFAGKHFRVTQTYTMGLGTSEKPSNLRKALKSWRGGREFTAEELKKFDLDLILNRPCVLNLEENIKGDKKYINVAGVLAAPKAACPTCNGVAGKKDCPKCKGRGTVLGMALWPIETPVDYVPDWVTKAREKQVPPPVKADAHAGEGAGVPDEEIPF